MEFTETTPFSSKIRFNIALTTTSVDLSCEELLRISEVAEKAKAAVHISHRSWQVFLGVPIQSLRFLGAMLRNMGYPCFQIEEGFEGSPTLGLKKEQG